LIRSGPAEADRARFKVLSRRRTGHFQRIPVRGFSTILAYSQYATMKQVRPFLCILVNLSLALAFVQAPFLHVHQHESTEKHEGAFIHAHFLHIDGHHSSKPELRDLDPDDDAQFQKWFAVASGDSAFSPVLLTSLCSVARPAMSNCPVIPIEPNAHGPPPVRTTPPRAPPV